jgi:hypothetical protein
MGGAEKVTDTDQEKELGKLSLAELEKMISDLKVVEGTTEDAPVDPEDLDFLK